MGPILTQGSVVGQCQHLLDNAMSCREPRWVSARQRAIALILAAKGVEILAGEYIEFFQAVVKGIAVYWPCCVNPNHEILMAVLDVLGKVDEREALNPRQTFSINGGDGRPRQPLDCDLAQGQEP